jgi:hypothetical protein
MSGSSAETSPRSAIRILNADATPEEIAAIVVALTAIASAATPAPIARRTSNWAAPARALRAPHRPGHDQWRSTNLPG